MRTMSHGPAGLHGQQSSLYPLISSRSNFPLSVPLAKPARHQHSRRSPADHFRRLTRVHAAPKEWTPPWRITFDLRERETQWTPENQARLVKLFAAEKLDIDVLEADLRLAQLCLLVPQLRSKIATMKPELLARLLLDPTAVAERLATLREALPALDLGSFAAIAPHVLLRDPDEVIREIAQLAELLAVDKTAAERIVNSHPRFLDSELVAEVLAELRRLMPSRDAARVLQQEPSWLLRVERGPNRLGPHPDDI